MLSRCILAYVLLFLTFFSSYVVIIVFAVTHLHISIVVHKWIFCRTSASITSKKGLYHTVFLCTVAPVWLLFPKVNLREAEYESEKVDGHRVWYKSEEAGTRDQSKDFVYLMTESHPYFLCNLTHRNVDNFCLFFMDVVKCFHAKIYFLDLLWILLCEL